MEQTECSETLAYKIQTSGIYPEESIQHSEHGGSLKSRILLNCCVIYMSLLIEICGVSGEGCATQYSVRLYCWVSEII